MRARARQDDSRVAWVVDTPSGETETVISAAADDSFGPPGASFPRAFAPEIAPAGSLPLPARGDGAGEGASRSRLRAHLARREPANDADWGMAEQRIPYPRKRAPAAAKVRRKPAIPVSLRVGFRVVVAAWLWAGAMIAFAYLQSAPPRIPASVAVTKPESLPPAAEAPSVATVQGPAGDLVPLIPFD